MIGMAFGKQAEKPGLLFEGPNFKVMKKVGQAGDTVEKHNHPGYNIVFTVVNGQVQVVLNDVEEYFLVPGKVLQFDGDNYVKPTFIEDGAIVVTLVEKA